MTTKLFVLFVLVLVALGLAIAPVSNSHMPVVDAAPAASTTNFVSSTHGMVESYVVPVHYVAMPLWDAGTGECGYYLNQGDDHRNGLVDPQYCTSTPNTPAALIKKHNKHTHHTTTTTVIVIDDGGVTVDDGGDNSGGGSTGGNKDNCNNGAGNGDNCTPGHSSGSNQGNGKKTGDQTNQGEQGKGKSKSDASSLVLIVVYIQYAKGKFHRHFKGMASFEEIVAWRDAGADVEIK